MAAQAATPVTTSTYPQSQFPLHGTPHPQPVSPANSVTATTANISPTSPRTPNLYLQHQLPLATRQLRPPKSPLYVPAVLRPTERPLKHSSPLTPPRSMSSSMDSTDNENSVNITRPTGDGQNGFGHLGDNPWRIEEDFGEVTGLPTREHWKADSASQICDSPRCATSFNLFFRRHHCRHCGHVFCSTHTPHTVPLDQDAKFHPEGNPSRACEHCWEAWKRWEVARCAASKRSYSGSTVDGSDTGSLATPTSPAVGMKGPKGYDGQPEAAASVPKDWNWSTF